MKKRSTFALMASAMCMLALTACGGGSTSDLLAVAQDNDNAGYKWGYVDSRDSRAPFEVNPQFSEAMPFHDGLAAARSMGDSNGLNKAWGFVNGKGEWQVQPTYKAVTAFDGGLAMAVPADSYIICIDRKGEKRFELPDITAASQFRNGYAMIVDQNGKKGYVNTKGKITINPQFDDTEPFHDGLAAVKTGDKWGYINEKGEFAINPQFDKAGDFHEGVAWTLQGGRFGYIDAKGETVIAPQFSKAGNFRNGTATVSHKGEVGHINKEGKYIVNPQYEGGGDFSDGLAMVMVGGKAGYIDMDGKMAIEPQFEQAMPFVDGHAYVKTHGGWGIIDKGGKYFVNPQFKEIRPLDEDIVTAVHADRKGTQARN